MTSSNPDHPAPARAPTSPAELNEGFRRHPELWLPLVAEVCRAHAVDARGIVPFPDGANLVAAAGTGHVVKLFPPFLRHQWESERRALPRFHGRVPVRVPALIAEGAQADGWHYLVLERLQGVLLEACWNELEHASRIALMREVGATMAAAHRLPLEGLADLPPEWSGFVRAQCARCRSRHEAQGMPPWLVEGAAQWVERHGPHWEESGERALLTGEYTPFNLLVERAGSACRLAGMIDFGDAMIGPPEYDLLGPFLFCCAGDPALVEALWSAYCGGHRPIDDELRARWLTLALLHRYASFDVQVRIPGWRERASSLEELAALIWPAPAQT